MIWERPENSKEGNKYMGESTKTVPLYIKVREFIKKQIDNGDFKAGDLIPTENELMEQFQVSRGTIKNALKYLVEEGLVYRVAGKGTYVASTEDRFHAELPEISEVRKIGFITEPLGSLLSIQLLEGIEEACREEGWLLMIKVVPTQKEERLAIRELLAANVEGLIIFPVDGKTYSDEILELKMKQFPFVLVDRYLPGIKTNSVYSDNYTGGFMGTEYLAGLGHKSIGVISAVKSSTSSSEDRFLGYLDAAKKHQLKISPNHWLTRMNEFTYSEPEVRQEYIKDWLKKESDITAVFALAPFLAVEVAEAAHALGKKIPDDLAILSFDDPQIITSDFKKSYFTWIEQDFEKMGTQAVQQLLRVINDPSSIEQIVLPVSLHEGFTT
jgi:GntR family transcriptional regulator of arabinose operon